MKSKEMEILELKLRMTSLENSDIVNNSTTLTQERMDKMLKNEMDVLAEMDKLAEEEYRKKRNEV